MKMKKIGLQIGVILFVLFTVQSNTFAIEKKSDSYLLIGGQQAEITEFMEAENMPIDKVYDVFSIIRASLSSSQHALLKAEFPKLDIQLNQKYEQAKDSELPSVQAVHASREFTSPYTGRGVKVAVLDSGVDTEHRDLLVKGGYCSLPSSECASGIPYDDDNGHGTHVAGIIAALENDTGIIGIAPKAELYSIKALNAFGVGSSTSLIDGIEWAIKNKMSILNLSITTDISDPAVKIALDAAYAKGMLIVGSVGNNGETADKSVMYPAKYESVIAVSAVTSDLKKMRESAIGPEVEIAAPGRNVFSTYPMEWDFIDGKTDGYTHLSGTSMATPHVTGILAIYKERFPHKSNVELRKFIQAGANPIGQTGKNDFFGYGLIQYNKELPGVFSYKTKSEVGKVTVIPEKPSTVTIEVDGKKVLPTNNEWVIYGVKGTKEIVVTMVDETGKKWIEKNYIKLEKPAFKDVQNSQRFAAPLGFMSNKKQITGFDDGTFRPYASITRGEAAALIGRALGYSGTPQQTVFKDVSSSSFASGYIKAATDAKIISGFLDGTFRPEANVTRAEMAILLSKGFTLSNAQPKTFTDVSESMAAYEAIKALTASGVTTGYSDNTFKPYDKMTRADFVVFLARAQEDSFK